MNRQPVLEGARLLLRPLEPDDWPALFAIGADPLLWEQHPMSDRWREPVFRSFFDDALAQGGALAVIDKAAQDEGEGGPGRLVGSSRFQNYDPAEGGSVEIGWTMLARDLWGSGVNAEMKRLMLAHALTAVERVDFRVGETNLRSRKAMEKIGARLTDRREEIAYEGRLVIHLIYKITRESFAEGPLSQE